ncbi:MAG: hypothetical protein SFY56_10960 [Bacteroidota bacterium]|nr:hypothetical protein [Bacteroidota bacterium]
METTKSTQNNEQLLENAKNANKWMSDAVATMMDVCKKQFDIMSGFYGNLFNSYSSETKNSLTPIKNFTDLFFNNGSLKLLYTPFSSLGVNYGFSNPFNNMFNQMKEYNQNLLGSFTKQFENGGMDSQSILDKYKKTVEKEIEASKHLISSLTNAYNKRLEFSIAESIKIQDEMNNQLKLLFEINQQFWSELFDNPKQDVMVDKYSKDSVANENKKPIKTTQTI